MAFNLLCKETANTLLPEKKFSGAFMEEGKYISETLLSLFEDVAAARLEVCCDVFRLVIRVLCAWKGQDDYRWILIIIVKYPVLTLFGELFFFLILFIYLSALGLSCSMWDLAPWPGIEPGPPALGAQSLSHWTTREVPEKNV